MSTYLVVRTLDVNYAPLEANEVSAAFDGGTPQPLAPTALPSVYELPVPAGSTAIEVSARAPHFWPLRQRLKLSGGKTTALEWVGGQEVNSRNLEAHSRGRDTNVILNVVLGQLQNARTDVDAVVHTPPPLNKAPIAYITPQPHLIRDFERSILARKTGWDRLRHTPLPGHVMYAIDHVRLRSSALVAICIVVFAAGCRPGQRQKSSPSNSPHIDGGANGRGTDRNEPARDAITLAAVRPLAPLSGAVARATLPTLRFVSNGPTDIELCAHRECSSPQLFANVTSPFTIPSIPSVSTMTSRVWYWRLVREGKPLTAFTQATFNPRPTRVETP